MDRYEIEIDRVIKTDHDGNTKTEIWAFIKNLRTSENLKKLIFWEDEHGHFHDETPNLPIEYRNLIDNAWIEKKRSW